MLVRLDKMVEGEVLEGLLIKTAEELGYSAEKKDVMYTEYTKEGPKEVFYDKSKVILKKEQSSIELEVNKKQGFTYKSFWVDMPWYTKMDDEPEISEYLDLFFKNFQEATKEKKPKKSRFNIFRFLKRGEKKDEQVW